MEGWQARVVEEKGQLDERLGKLRAFMGGEGFKKLPVEEQTRLYWQDWHMGHYSAILGKRIEAWGVMT